MRQEWEEWIKQDRPVPTTKAGNLDWVSRAWASSDHSAFQLTNYAIAFYLAYNYVFCYLYVVLLIY